MPASVDVDDLQGQLQVVQEVASRAPDLGALLTRRALNLAVAAHRLVAATKGSSAFTSDCLRFAASGTGWTGLSVCLEGTARAYDMGAGLSDGSAAMDYQAVIEVATATGHLDQAEATTRRAFQVERSGRGGCAGLTTSSSRSVSDRGARATRVGWWA